MAWTPIENTYNNFLIIELNEKKLIMKVATAGRAGTRDFVTEYIVQYSDDGEIWRSYSNQNNEPQVITESNRKVNVFDNFI